MKLKYLLPAATIASVATVVTPLVTSCGNATVKLDKFEHNDLIDTDVLTTTKTINLEKGKKYTVKIDMQKWSGDESSYNDSWMFGIYNSAFTKTLPIRDHSVKINGNKLKFESVGDNVDSADEYSCEENTLFGWPKAVNKSSKIEITFKANDSLDDAKLCFTFCYI